MNYHLDSFVPGGVSARKLVVPVGGEFLHPHHQIHRGIVIVLEVSDLCRGHLPTSFRNPLLEERRCPLHRCGGMLIHPDPRGPNPIRVHAPDLHLVDAGETELRRKALGTRVALTHGDGDQGPGRAHRPGPGLSHGGGQGRPRMRSPFGCRGVRKEVVPAPGRHGISGLRDVSVVHH